MLISEGPAMAQTVTVGARVQSQASPRESSGE